MATLDQLEKALNKAEQSGNIQDVNELKRLIINKQSQSSYGGGLARSAGQGLTFGFGDEIVAGLKAPFTDKSYKEELDLERAKLENFREAYPKTAIASEIAGSFALPFAGGVGRGIAKGIQQAGKIVGNKTGKLGDLATQGAIAGGAYGAGTSEGDIVDDTLKGATLTGLLNPALSKVGQKLLNPQITAEAKKLMSKGVELSTGQKLGGLTKSVEDASTSIPILGGGISQSRQKSIETFNTSVINDALKSIGEKLPDNIKFGNKAIDYMSRAIGKKYDDLVPESGIKVNENFFNILSNLEQKMGQTLRQKQFQNFIKDEVLRPLNQTGQSFTGKQYKNLISTLGKKISANKGISADEFAEREALKSVRTLLNNELKKQHPKIALGLSQADKAYAKSKRILTAGAKNKESGLFTPDQYLQAIRQQDYSMGKGQFARGKSLNQNFAQSAQSVIPSKLPNSGTADRLGLGVLGVGGYFDPVTALGSALALGSGRMLMSPQGQKITSKLFTERPRSIRNLADRLQTSSPFITGGLLNN